MRHPFDQGKMTETNVDNSSRRQALPATLPQLPQNFMLTQPLHTHFLVGPSQNICGRPCSCDCFPDPARKILNIGQIRRLNDVPRSPGYPRTAEGLPLAPHEAIMLEGEDPNITSAGLHSHRPPGTGRVRSLGRRVSPGVLVANCYAGDTQTF